ncbi:hypothetical protein ES707_02255 [subsurface metagenome]
MHGTIKLSQTPSRTTSHLWVALLLCVAGALVLAVPSLRTGVFEQMSTDDAMRLVEVRDLLAGQSWFDLTQYRLDPPHGGSMHWSRLIDAPIAGLILLLRPMLGIAGAEQAALALWPTTMLAAALVLVGMISVRMAGGARRQELALAAMIAAALAAPALIHFRAGAIDHHNAQIVLLLCFLFFAADIEHRARSALFAGLSVTMSLAVGVEMLPAFAAGCVTVLGLVIWRGTAVGSSVAVFGATLAGSSALLAVLLLPPHSWTAPVFDAFGGPVLLLLVGGGVSLMIVSAVAARRADLHSRVVAAGVSGSLLLAVFFAAFPRSVASPYAAVDPLVTSLWLDHVAEVMSLKTLLALQPERIAGNYAPPLATLALAGMVMARAPRKFRYRWALASSVIAASLAISFWQIRGAAGATMAAAPVFVASLAVLWPLIERRRLLLAVVFASPAVLGAAGMAGRPLLDVIAPPAKIIAKQDGVSTCRGYSSVVPLAALPRGRIVAPIDLGPGILAATEHSVFAGPYHRNNDGNLVMIRTMMADPDTARRILGERQVDYVALCRGSLELKELLELAPDGLAARLGRGEVPDFLEPVTLTPSGNLTVWRVRP